MAVKQAPPVTTPPLICLSSDTKPSGLQAGHLAYETDTGAWYIYNGTSWVTYSGPGPQTPEQINLAAQGLIAQNFDRQLVISTTTMVNGTVYFMLVPLRAGQVVSNVSLVINVQGADMTLGKVGLYDTEGNRLGASASQTTAWQTAGLKTVALTSPVTITTPGGYYVALIATATTTLPTLFRGVSGGGQISAAAVGSGAPPLGAEQGQTDLDATATIGNSATIGFWVGLS